MPRIVTNWVVLLKKKNGACLNMMKLENGSAQKLKNHVVKKRQQLVLKAKKHVLKLTIRLLNFRNSLI